MSFSEFLRPDGGLIVFTTIPGQRTRTFDFPGERGAARAWLKEQNAERKNAYFQHQILSLRHKRRIDANAVTAVRFIHLDYDWSDASGKRITASPEQIAAKVAELKAWEDPSTGRPLPPSALIGSGNGLQCLWQLQLPASISLAKQANRGVLMQFGGDPSGSDGVKLLRVPGFTNWPHRHPGLKPTRSYVIELNERAYGIADFPLIEDLSAKAGKPLKVSADVEEVTSLDGLNIPAVLREIIETGRTDDPNHQPNDLSRSGWLIYGVKWLVGIGVPDGQILGILVNSLWSISESVLEQDGRTEEDYARRQVERAKAHMKAQVLERFEPSIVETIKL